VDDLFVSFRDDAGSWTTPVNLGEPVNSGAPEICALVTPDGRRLVFNSFRSGNADNYSVDAGIIDELRPPGGQRPRGDPVGILSRGLHGFISLGGLGRRRSRRGRIRRTLRVPAILTRTDLIGILGA
jgi:hypothetical protein